MSETIGSSEPIEVVTTQFKHPQQVKLERRLKQTRVLVWVLAAFIAINTAAALYIGQLYQRPEFNTGAASVESALSSYRSNDALSTTVYQQIVTNGWVARDLLETVGKQNAVIIEQNAETSWMLGWLLFNILFTLGWLSIAVIRIGLTHLELSEARIFGQSSRPGVQASAN